MSSDQRPTSGTGIDRRNGAGIGGGGDAMDRGAGPVDVCESGWASWVATSSRLIAAHFRFSGTCDYPRHPPTSSSGRPSDNPDIGARDAQGCSGAVLRRPASGNGGHLRGRSCGRSSVSRERPSNCVDLSHSPGTRKYQLDLTQCSTAKSRVHSMESAQRLGLRCASFSRPWRSRNFLFPRQDRLTGCQGRVPARR